MLLASVSPTPKRVKELSGHVYGRLTVVGFARIERSAIWVCQCSCGEVVEVKSPNLIRGGTRSCGCVRRTGTPKHGMSETPEYRTWHSMINRCKYKSVNSYPSYGGRGITVCDRWHSFDNFYADMGTRPEGTTLDRIDSDGHYTPDNCRWATTKEQGRNKRNSILLTARGITKQVNDWAEDSGVAASTIVRRIKSLGWDVEKAIFTPTNSFQRCITYKGETLNCSDWALRCGVTTKTITNRLDRGLETDQVLKELI